MTSTREGSILLALAAAALAGLLLFVFVKGYRDNVNGDNASRSVFVARSLIPRGSSAAVIAAQQLLQRTSLKGKEVKAGAITDPSAIAGKVTTADIAPGQQITAASFAAGGDGVVSQLVGTDRAIAVPVDATHGLDGQLRDGDHVDVYAGFAGNGGGGQTSLRTLLQNVLVLRSPVAAGGGIGGGSSNAGNVLLKADDRAASLLAYAADNGKIWLVLRPPAGAKQGAPTVVTTNSLFSRAASGGR